MSRSSEYVDTYSSTDEFNRMSSSEDKPPSPLVAVFTQHDLQALLIPFLMYVKLFESAWEHLTVLSRMFLKTDSYGCPHYKIYNNGVTNPMYLKRLRLVCKGVGQDPVLENPEMNPSHLKFTQDLFFELLRVRDMETNYFNCYHHIPGHFSKFMAMRPPHMFWGNGETGMVRKLDHSRFFCDVSDCGTPGGYSRHLFSSRVEIFRKVVGPALTFSVCLNQVKKRTPGGFWHRVHTHTNITISHVYQPSTRRERLQMASHSKIKEQVASHHVNGPPNYGALSKADRDIREILKFTGHILPPPAPASVSDEQSTTNI